jgi:prepilin-type processing-associated H-X9-DG protein
VGAAPYFTRIPATSYNVNGGGTLVLPATLAGTPQIGYYWTDQNAGTNVAAGVTNSSQLNASLTVSNVPGSWNGDTLVLTVTNAYGATNYSVSLVVNTNPPQITQNLPVQVPVVSGKTYTYSIGVTGSLPLAYQWYDNGTPVAGQTAATYSLAAGSPGSGGNYSVVVSNYSGAVTSLVSTLTVIGPLTNAYATNLLGYAPAGYWPLQETNAPAAATIETNYGLLGALGNAYYAITNATNVSFDLPGLLANDSAIGFNGLNGTVTPSFAFVPRLTPALTLQPPLSLECWIYSGNTSFGDLIGEGGSGLNSPSGGGNAGGLRLSYGGTLQLYVFTGSGITRPDIGTANNMTLNTWHHCVATFDGTNAILYVDGQNQASGQLTMALDTWTPLTIGAGFWQGTGPIRGFDGTEAQVAIYTNVLTPQQVENDYLAGTTPGSNYVQTVMGNDPLLYYHMDAPGFTNTPAALCPVAVNYGSAAPNGAYLSGTRPGYLPGPPNKAHTNEVALAVNGYTACVDAGYDPAFNPTGTQAFTALLWFQGNPADGRLQTLISHGTNWTLNLDGTTGYVDWTAAGTVVSTNILNDSNWHLAAGVHTGTTNYLYVDGQLNAIAPVSGSLVSDPGDDLYLGGNAADVLIVDNQQYFAGSLAEAAFYTNALTATQIQQLYTAAAGSTAPPTVSILPSGGNVIITYTGTLLYSTNVVGPYNPVSGASSPYLTPATNAQIYYRTHQ